MNRPCVVVAVCALGVANAADPPLTESIPRGAVGRLGPAPFSHHGRVRQLAFAPDGGLAVSGLLGFSVWNRGGRALYRVGAYELEAKASGARHPIAFSPDGRIVAHARIDGRLALCKATTGEPIHESQIDDMRVVGLSFSADGKLLALSGTPEDGEESVGRLKILDAATRTVILEVEGGDRRCGARISTADEVALARRDKVAILNARSGKLVREIADEDLPAGVAEETRERAVSSALLSRDGRRLAFAGRCHALVVEVATGKRILSVDRADAVFVSPDGDLLFHDVVGEDSVHTFRMIQIDSGRELWRERARELLDVAFSPDSKCVAWSDYGCRARVVEATTGKDVVAWVGHATEITSLAFSMDDKKIVSGDASGTVREWDDASKHIRSFGVGDGEEVVTALAASADGKIAVAWNHINPRLAVRDASGHELHLEGTDSLRTTKRIEALALSADGTRLLVHATLWDLGSGKPTSLEQSELFGGAVIGFDREGLPFSIGDRLTTWTARGRSPRPGAAIVGRIKAVSPNGRTAAVTSDETSEAVEIADLETGRRTAAKVHLALNAVIRSVSPGRDWILASDEKGLSLHPLDGREARRLERTRDVFCLSVSHDGTRLATGHADGSILIWSTSIR